MKQRATVGRVCAAHAAQIGVEWREVAAQVHAPREQRLHLGGQRRRRGRCRHLAAAERRDVLGSNACGRRQRAERGHRSERRVELLQLGGNVGASRALAQALHAPAHELVEGVAPALDDGCEAPLLIGALRLRGTF